LDDPEFNDHVQNSWICHSPLHCFSPSQNLLDNLASIRNIVKPWQISKKKSNRNALEDIQKEMDKIASRMSENCLPLKLCYRIKELEFKKLSLLAIA